MSGYTVSLQRNLTSDDAVRNVAKASLNGVGVRGLLSNDRRIFGVRKEWSDVIIFGVFRASWIRTGVEVSVGRTETGVEVDIPDMSRAVIGLLKNCEGENGKDFIGVFWGVLHDGVSMTELLVLNVETLRSSRCLG